MTMFDANLSGWKERGARDASAAVSVFYIWAFGGLWKLQLIHANASLSFSSVLQDLDFISFGYTATVFRTFLQG